MPPDESSDVVRKQRRSEVIFINITKGQVKAYSSQLTQKCLRHAVHFSLLTITLNIIDRL